MLYINDTCTDPYWNLAAEEYLLKSIDEPVFRLWRNSNSIIIGHYQNALAEINIQYIKDNGIKVVRRLTGGGAVFHDLGNLNFTFIEERKPGEDTSAMFRRFTAPIIEALNSIGIRAYIEGRNDLLIDGKKFSGNAICIHKNRILQHGTLLFEASMDKLGAALKSRPEKFIGKAVQSNRSRVTNIKEHLLPGNPYGITDITSFEAFLSEFICNRYPNIERYTFSGEDNNAIGKLCAEKYSQDNWNFGSSPSYSFSRTVKFPGGLVELYMNVEKGKISDLKIMGDYFFTLPTDEFCKKIIGTEHTHDEISKRLSEIDNHIKTQENPLGISTYFNNIGQSELESLFFE
ncbi:MAG: lipoate--protein ligase [Bacteroidales bacterium]|nr:lipoate--protein ligase [Bacteroidales bacterium]